MAKGLYQFLRDAWKETSNHGQKDRLIEWRRSPSQVRVEKPSRIDRARSLGYKSKKGFVVIRSRVRRGGHKRPRPVKGRRSKRMHTRKDLKMNYKWIAEQRVEKKFTNLTVLNSYEVGKDGKHYFFEVICVDPSKNEIKSDKDVNWISKPSNQKRSFRGLTSAGKKSRGLRHKSPTQKTRPSVRKGPRGK
ncbi:MAG: 50S ribosomal protein L15e [Candidatus Pacearchaeota archaeon]